MAATAREPGDEIGGYTVVDHLGRGGSGAVYRVRDGGGDVAALKLVDARNDEVAARRLEREVHALQSLRHPAVPRILDAELDADETFVVFEYIPGDSLWQYVQDNGPLRADALAEFADRTASALEAVHAAGVVHRDVTPSNIMMGPEGPVLIDFGLSHQTQDERLTRDGLVSGTAGYVAPEVIDGADPGPIADRWAWAATLAYTMTGTAPFGSGAGAISRTLEAKVELPEVPGVEAVKAALGRDIGARPGPRDVVAALRGATAVMPTSEEESVTEVVPSMAATAVLASDPRGHATTDATAVMPTESGFDEPRVQDPEPSGDWEQVMLDPASEVGADEPPLSDEVPLAPAKRHPWMVGSWILALAASAALAPFVALMGLVSTAILVRAVQRRALALHASRQRRGARRGDAALHTLGLPWHLVRAAGETVPAALIAAASGGGVAALGWWLVSTGRLGDGTPEAQAWGHGIALAVGGIAAAAVLWWGPWMEMTRDGGHRVASALAPSTGVAAAWTLVALAGIVVVTLAVYLLAEPWWWPAPDLPQ